MIINYVHGDATRPDRQGNQVLVHCCNDLGLWGKGFALSLTRRWSKPEQAYKKWKLGRDFTTPSPFTLGEVQFVQVESSPGGSMWVANMLCQAGITPQQGIPPIRYDALRQALERVNGFAVQNDAVILGPRFGAGLAGGEWLVIEKMIREVITVDVFIYIESEGVR